MLFSCSSSDAYYNTDNAIYISKTEITYVPTADQLLNLGYSYNIYIDGDKDICFSYFFADSKSGSPTYASIGTCPKEGSPKYLYVLSERDGSTFKNPCFYCKSCGSKFNINTGKAKNDQAKGFSIPIYRAKSVFSNNGAFTGVYIWK